MHAMFSSHLVTETTLPDFKFANVPAISPPKIGKRPQASEGVAHAIEGKSGETITVG
jgi:hypothetical protein